MTVETVHPRSILTRTSALLVGTAAAVTLVACSPGTPDTTAAAPSTGVSGAAFDPSDLPASVAGRTSMQAVEFKNGDITMAGNVFVPADFDANRTYPTIVVVHPGGGVKEQTGASTRSGSPIKASSPWPSTRRIRAPAAARPASWTTR